MTKQQPCLQAENEQLRAGYDAARLEIESLKERVQQPGQPLVRIDVLRAEAKAARAAAKAASAQAAEKQEPLL